MTLKESIGSRIFNIINVIFMILLSAVMLYPFIYVTAASLSDPALVARGDVMLIPKGITLEAYKRVLKDEFVILSYWNTIRYTVVQTVMTLFFTATTAYPLSKKRLLGRKVILRAIAFTMLFSGGMIPQFIVVRKLGMYNSMWALIIPSLISTWNLLIMRTFFEGIPEELEDAAAIDGCSSMRLLVKIVLPLSMPVMATVGLYTAVGQWNSFFDALIYLSEKRLYPLQIHLRNIIIANSAAAQKEAYADGGEMIIMETVKYATIMVATLPILCVYPFIQKYFVQGSMMGSIKA